MRRIFHIACYVDADEHAHLRREATKRGVSLSAFTKACLLGGEEPAPYSLAQRDEASGLEPLLRAVERRIDTRIGETNAEILRRLALLNTMLDRFVLTMLSHTPEIPKEHRKGAAASGERRYGNWKRAVAELLNDMIAPETRDAAESESSQQNGTGAAKEKVEDGA